ncbi:MAG TPA: GntR family transcriptional regulator [Stellaceae bacterium]|nr:GntR family transcriptional regulator [Stellaceae bacterium]
MERPLYRVVADQIETRIAKGVYAVGTQLPPEPALEEEFKVSRITVRQALGLLKRRGILVSQSGLGTVVRFSGADARSMSVSGSMRDLIYYAAGTRYEPLDREAVKPPAEVAAAFGMRLGRLMRFRGLRGWPSSGKFGFEAVYIPEALGRDLDNSRLGNATLFSLLEAANGIKITEVEQTITAVPAPAVVARHLGIRLRAPMLKATRAYKRADGQLVEFAISLYDVAQFQYVMKLFPD